MTLKEMNRLATKVAVLEGKKSQTRIGQIREVLKCVEHVMAQEALDNQRVIGTRDAIDSQSFNALEAGIDKLITKALDKLRKAQTRAEAL